MTGHEELSRAADSRTRLSVFTWGVWRESWLLELPAGKHEPPRRYLEKRPRVLPHEPRPSDVLSGLFPGAVHCVKCSAPVSAWPTVSLRLNLSPWEAIFPASAGGAGARTLGSGCPLCWLAQL